jgi:myosin-1
MVLLAKAGDEGITDNLKARLVAGEIYTNIGHVLVAANPYKWLDIYGEEHVKKYTHAARVDVAPHVFATAEAAYRNMVTEDDNQCVIISGESGAGKTEASKQIQNYIAAVCGGGEDVDKLKTTFLESNPVLEAFGNAKTVRNNNSSRFGKYFTLKFNRFGIPLGGKVTNYLLEKSRIVRPGKDERNFHIFYQLLSSEVFTQPLGLSKDPNAYRFLSVSKCSTVEGMSDTAEFKTTVKAMNHVGIKNKQIQAILSLVASVLHMGNVQFSEKDVNGSEGSKINKESKSALTAFCDLTKTELEQISHTLLFRQLQTMAPGGKIDTYEVPQNPAQAAQRRDAIAKALYERLFDLIVERINVALAIADADMDDEDMLHIGVLDIYGFEVFEKNGFEQMCINYVNEKLQQIFIELTLRAEQDEYSDEGIQWTPIPFFNNKIVCELMDGLKPKAGLFRLLDDTCKTLHGMQDTSEVDRKFLETVTGMHNSHAHFKPAQGGGGKAFQIKHYAGDVTYHLGKFSQSNNDSLGKDILLAIQTSTDNLVSRLFSEVVDLNDKKAPPTSGFKIRTQCQALVTALMECSPHYVRCIKSNDQKAALKMDMARCKHQVQYLGLNENIKVRRAGYAYRAEYFRFLARFSILSPATYPEWRGSDKDGCRKILAAASKSIARLTKDEAQLGTSKIFIRAPETYFALEKLREVRLGDFVAKVQRAWRSYKGLKEYVLRQRAMAGWYQDKRKARRRDSIFRPYMGDYLSSLGGKQEEEVKEALFRVIDYYDENENVLFADDQCAQLMCPPMGGKGNAAELERKLVVLTDGALYILDNLACGKRSLEQVSAGKAGRRSKKGGVGQAGAGGSPSPRTLATSISCLDPAVNASKALPALILRRRIPIKVGTGLGGGKEGCINSISLSGLADTGLAISVVPQNVQRLAELEPKTDHFRSDEGTTHCSVSNVPFSLFNRRHHCRASGAVCADAVCNFTQCIPDYGYYTPQRVNDHDLGLLATDLSEDVVLLLPRKTELAALLRDAWEAAHGKALAVAFSNIMRLAGGVAIAPTGFFASQLGLSSSLAPSEVTFKELPAQTHPAASLVDATVSGGEGGSRAVVVACPSGLGAQLVEEKQARAAERQAMKDKKRRKQDKERRKRAAAKEEEREQARLERLEAKRAKKQQEKASRKAAAADEASVASSAAAKKQGGRSFGGGGAKTSGGRDEAAPPMTELQKKMAARRGGN